MNLVSLIACFAVTASVSTSSLASEYEDAGYEYKAEAPSKQSSTRAYNNFLKALSERLNLPLRDGVLPTGKIPVKYCDLKIVEAESQDVTRITAKQASRNVYLHVERGAPAEFKVDGSDFMFAVYTQDTEEQGPSGMWYANQILEIKGNQLKLINPTSYAHELYGVECELKDY